MKLSTIPERPRVLVIDDEPVTSALLERVLDLEGYDVTIALDGASGIDAVRADQPELIVLDLNLPDLHGYDVCRAIRKETDTPVFVLSGDSDAVEALDVIDIGADDAAVKPCAPHDLAARIGVLHRRQVEAALREKARASQRRMAKTVGAGFALTMVALIGLGITFASQPEPVDVPAIDDAPVTVVIDTGTIVSPEGDTEISAKTISR